MLFVKHAEFLYATEMNILAMSLPCWSIAACQWEQLSSCAVFLFSKDFGDLSWEVGALKRSRAFLQNKMVSVAVVLSLVAVLVNVVFKENNKSAAKKCFWVFNIRKISCWELFLAIHGLHPSLQPSIHTGKALVVTRQKLVGKLFNEFREKAGGD